MTREATDLLNKALSLSVTERAELAASLIDSLDGSEDETVVAAWNQEIVRRIEELNSDPARAVSWEEVRRRISARLAHGR
jgi:putative addiction module component (TIGR02574 family)